MSVLVIANDVIPGFGVPVAAPGIRAAGLVEGLRSHGHDVEVAVPQTIIDKVWSRPRPPSPPAGATVVNPSDLHAFISGNSLDHVVFSNANMAPHLQPVDGTRFIYDMFAPKVLELLSSDRTDRSWTDEATKKERALALSDHIFVNGRRKLGYALGWLLRPSVQRIRTERLGLAPLVTADPMKHLSLVEMPVPLPIGVDVRPPTHTAGRPLRVGIAGYVQRWSAMTEASPAQNAAFAAGHEVHVLSPEHWGGTAPNIEANPPDKEELTRHLGPLGYADFARWLQSMDVLVDEFAQSAERHMAMITRSAVALRFGVPVVHGVDSEISDLVREFDAGWVVSAGDRAAWKAAFAEAADPEILHRKQVGAQRISSERFAPSAALLDASQALETF